MTWPMIRFEKLYSEPSRNGVYKPIQFHGSGVRIVNMGELFAYGVIADQEMKRLAMSEPEMARSCLVDGDLLFGRRSLVESGAGKCSLVEALTEPTTFESSIIRVRVDERKIRPRFVYYWLKSHSGQGAIRAIVTGTNVKGIKGSVLKDILVPCPETSTQDRVIELIRTYDDLIENNQRRIQLLEQAARLLYKEWFVHLRFPGHEHVKIKDGIPDGWEIRPINKSIEGLFDGPHATPPPSDDGPIFLGIKNITETGHLDLSSLRNIAENDFPKWTKRVLPQPGDIVFSYEATLNLYALIPDGFRGCLGRRLALIRPKAEERNGLFIFLSFFSKRWRDVIERNRLSGATVDRIPLVKFPYFPLLYPTKQLVLFFDDQVKPIFDQLQVLSRQNQKLVEARDLLLPRLMSGDMTL